MLILDDDPIISTVVKHHLAKEFPEAEISVCREPEAHPGYDVYFLDNDFGGHLLGLSLLEEIRQVAPHALIVALSNTLDMKVMSEMVNGGCNAVYNKRDLAASVEARTVIATYLSIVANRRTQSGGVGVLQVVSSLRQLIETWNRRLSRSERAVASPLRTTQPLQGN